LDQIALLLSIGKDDPIAMLQGNEYTDAIRMMRTIKNAPNGMFVETISERLSFPRDVINKFSGTLLIVAPAGHGKTSFCRYNALSDTERYSLKQSDILPVYVPLYQHRTGILHSFHDEFMRQLGKSALIARDNENCNNYKSDKKIRIYLDGLDEIPRAERRKTIMDMTKAAVEDNRDMQVIVTSREYVQDEYLEWIPPLHLSQFSEAEIMEFVHNWLGQGRDAKLLLEQLKDNSGLRALMQVPLLYGTT
jgi:predicted NACHT family NTPase